MSKLTLMHFWSLALEEQFYFAWPVLVQRASHRRTSYLRIAVAIVCPLIRGVELWNSCLPYEVVYRPEASIDSLAFGSLLALLETHLQAKHKESFVGCLAIFALLLSAYFTRHHYWFDTIGPSIESIAAGLLVLNVKDGINRLARILSSKPVVWLGTISTPFTLAATIYLFITARPPSPGLPLSS